MVEQVLAFFSKSAAGGKSTALRPLQWTLAILLTASFAAAKADALPVVQWGIGLAGAFDFLTLLIAYCYFMFTAPEHLRTEWYAVEIKRLEKGLLGDSVSGLKAGRIHERAKLKESSSGDQSQ